MRTIVLCWSAAIVGLWVLLLAGCSTVPTWAPVHLDMKSHYRFESTITINGVKAAGATLIDPAARYDLRIQTADKFDLLILASCHREMTLSKSTDDFRLSLVPQKIETDEYCPWTLYTLGKAGYFSVGMVIPRNGDYALPGAITCNGEKISAVGWSFCQSRTGLLQELSFSEPVLLATTNSCNQQFEQLDDGSRLRWTISEGHCRFEIRGVKSRKFHQLLTYGYTQFLIER